MKIKQKTLSSLKKRVKTTATGKYRYYPGGTSHNNRIKSSKRKRLLHRAAISLSLRKRLKRLLPYM
ncbi:MAG: bL35 family ribosomal protein [candidate division WOR-3 bacterium]